MANKTLPLFDPALLWPTMADAFRKLDPRVQLRNPVMLVVYIGSIFTTLLTVTHLDCFSKILDQDHEDQHRRNVAAKSLEQRQPDRPCSIRSGQSLRDHRP